MVSSRALTVLLASSLLVACGDGQAPGASPPVHAEAVVSEPSPPETALAKPAPKEPPPIDAGPSDAIPVVSGVGKSAGGNSAHVGQGQGTVSGAHKGRGQPTVTVGNATFKGNLDENIIRRYIRRALSKIRHCYEKELTVMPTLKGTVRVKFIIEASGAVEKATARGMPSAVSSCVAATIKAIQFPKPTGGLVIVTYPFTFVP